MLYKKKHRQQHRITVLSKLQLNKGQIAPKKAKYTINET